MPNFMARIEKRYKDEWVLLSDPKLVNGQIVGGKVVFHHKDRDKMYQKMLELKLKSFATLYTGRPPYPVILAAA
jgi:hypothetical protein